ncbi:HET-domain-containing protein [Thozetella sp. PMI_491]|nr:HET-domain-containing protein [Thozetella sp. PMI_491]
MGGQKTKTLPDTGAGDPRQPSGPAAPHHLTCDVCTTILQAFAWPASESFEGALGIVQDLLASSCPHTQLIRWASQIWSGSGDIIHVSRDKDSTHSELRHYIEREGLSAVRYSPGFGLLARPDNKDHPGRVCVVNPEWVNAAIARDWLSRCEAEHGRRCAMHRITNLDGRRPRWLIDVVDGCIRSGAPTLGDSQLPYLTLSYTWGRTATLQAKRSNFAQLQQPGVLFRGGMNAQMPQTIRDAMGITKAIGYRFLWVDSLCIQQDARDEMADELAAMHLIYANSALCIVAEAGANAEYGLRGFPGVSSSGRHAGQVIMPLADGEQVASLDSMSREGERKEGLAYHSRMWTFQEYLFAKRRLVFAQGPLEWHCNSASWREDLIGLARRTASYGSWENTEKWLLSPSPLLSNMNDLIENFNHRLLSYPEDVPRAFAGTQTLLHRTFPGGLLLGLPEFWFDIALWWLGDSRCRRRPASATDPDLALPSWSWMGWQEGEIFFPGDVEFTQAGAREEYAFTAPVTTWYAIGDPKHPPSQRRKIASAWSAYKDLARKTGSGHDLPDGWTAEPVTLPSHSPLRCPKSPPSYGFFHESTSRDNTNRFWYPLPAVSHNQAPSTGVELPPQTRYLACKTTRAFLYASSDMVKLFLRRSRFQVLRDSSGAFAGVLNLHEESDDEQDLLAPIIPASTSEGTGQGTRVELVAILKGWTDAFSHPYDILNGEAIEHSWDPHWHGRAEESGSGSPSYVDENKEAWDALRDTKDDCYYALWIEWRGGVAYRKGTGVVVAQRWDEAREESLVDLVLG